MRDVTTLGPYTAGEIPEPWEHTFADSAGEPIDLSGFGAGLVYRVDDADSVVRTASIVDGATRVEWTDVDLGAPGLLRGELVADNGAVRFVRRVEMFIRRAAASVFPSFAPRDLDGGGPGDLQDEDIDGGGPGIAQFGEHDGGGPVPASVFDGGSPGSAFSSFLDGGGPDIDEVGDIDGGDID